MQDNYENPHLRHDPADDRPEPRPKPDYLCPHCGAELDTNTRGEIDVTEDHNHYEAAKELYVGATIADRPKNITFRVYSCGDELLLFTRDMASDAADDEINNYPERYE
jgi:hypothetical protein